MGNVLKRKLTDLLSNTISVVTTRADTFFLNKRMYTTAEETSLAVGFYFYDRSIARDTLEVHAIRCTEVAKTVGNKTSLVDLSSTDDMRSVTIDDVSTVVNTKVGQTAQMASFLVKEDFHRVRQMTASRALSTTMKGDDDEVCTADKVVDDSSDCSQIIVSMLQSIGIMSEGTESYLQSLALNDSRLDASLQSCILDALFLQHMLSRDNTLLTEVVSVVVGPPVDAEFNSDSQVNAQLDRKSVV